MTERIDSAHNPRIRGAAQLRLRRDRKKSNLILIDGVREAQRALDAGIEFIEVFLGADRAITPALEALHLALIDRGTTIHETAPAAYAKVRYGDRDDGVVVVARRPQRRLDALKLPPAPLIAVVDQVEKPGKIGRAHV